MNHGNSHAIEEAKAVVRANEAALWSGDLDAIMSNMAEDGVALAPPAPLLEGLEAARALYTQLLAMGRIECRHEYSGAAAVGDVVVLHGIAKNTCTPPGGEPFLFANSFILTYRRCADGRWRCWRAAFAPTEA